MQYDTQKFFKTIRSQQGLTLVEILVSTVIVSAVTVALVTIYLTAYKGYDRSNAINLMQEEGNRIISVMTRSIHASTLAENTGANLVLTLDPDSIEYKENGECKTVTFVFVPGDAVSDGTIRQVFTGCEDPTLLGGYENTLSNKGNTTGIHVVNFSTSVRGGALDRTQLVSIDFVLAQSRSRNDRGNYDVEVPFQTKISTRGYAS